MACAMPVVVLIAPMNDASGRFAFFHRYLMPLGHAAYVAHRLALLRPRGHGTAMSVPLPQHRLA